MINAARKCPKFIIGRVQGKAVGGGVGMASATDYCFATKFASAKLSELSYWNWSFCCWSCSGA